MLEVKITGGLGNQMFQYAFSQYLKAAQNEVILNVSDYKAHKYHTGFELKRIFNIKDDCNNLKPSFGIDATAWYVRIIRKLFHVLFVKTSEYHEKAVITEFPFKKIDQDFFLVGYWQKYQYIKPVEASLCNIFTFPELSGKNELFYEQIKDKETVAVHVRRGDYLKNAELSSICDQTYYGNAIQYIREKVNEPLFIFFSDDPEWCKQTFKNLYALYVDWNKGDESYRDMQLMSLCKYNIIANSTFSWWGAWLNRSEGKIMIAPRRWSSSLDENYLCGEQWVLL